MKESELKHIPLIDIVVSKTNPRKSFDQESILELAQSIIQKGVLQPIVVRPNGKPGKYEVVCGERRFRASIEAQVAKKDITSIPAVIRELTNEEALELQIIENLQRKDVHPMEEAVAFKGLIDLNNFDVHEIAKRIGKGATYVAQRLKLNDLSPDFQKAFYQNRLTLTTAMKLCKISVGDQKEIWKEDQMGTGTIEVNNWTIKKYMADLNDAPFDIKDENLRKDVGACIGCQFNSASNSLLFPEAAHKAVCMNSQCYKQKVNISYGQELKKAIEDPAIVLVDDSYSPTHEAKNLIQKGEKLYTYGQFEEEEKPEAPDADQFEEDLNDGEYDDRDSMTKDYQSQLKDYEKELKQWEKEVGSGKFLRAFIVGGDNKGKYIFIKLRGTGSPKQTSAGAKAKAAEGKLTQEDIKAELQRIRDSEKRKKELDGEKIYYQAYEVLSKSNFQKLDSPLTIEELRAGIIFLMATNHEACRLVEKQLKIGNQWTYFNAFNKLQEMKTPELLKLFNCALRVGITHKFYINAPQQNYRIDSHGDCASLFAIAKHYEGTKVAAIEKEQMDERLKREGRVTERIEKLNKQLKELNKPGVEKFVEARAAKAALPKKAAKKK